ncbi:glycosyltransferase family 15 protein [Seminavis robusta]|uniref:Glycosyltransferase family 15 protein n=1 Tax=Seminavis robusta TaxID=568900 RepID=A0A9N8DY00_9STRA|nr:glycosyltransferase family 15 protein [Seminavis robusta]|eukprot:Sro456_g146740.1 glycosyltransferase family 15 protein (522) ;mRNA; f:51743-53308
MFRSSANPVEQNAPYLAATTYLTIFRLLVFLTIEIMKASAIVGGVLLFLLGATMRVEVKFITTVKEKVEESVQDQLLQNTTTPVQAVPGTTDKEVPSAANPPADPPTDKAVLPSPPNSTSDNIQTTPVAPSSSSSTTTEVATSSPNSPQRSNAGQDKPPICEGGGKMSSDAIVMLIQKKHSSYADDHTVDIAGPLLSLQSAYKAVRAADVLLWHEGEFALSDIPLDKLQGMNVRLCNLMNADGIWGPPPGAIVPPKSKKMPWAVGYRNMIRFYGVTIWNVLSELGYDYMMRLDDDSNFMSPIPYNMFDALRNQNAVYGYRQESQECGSKKFSPFMDRFIKKNKIVPKHGAIEGSYCDSKIGRFGYYNNFSVTKVSWWHEPLPALLVRKFDESNLIYTDRDGDLILHTAVVKLFAEPKEVLKYVDWTYAHVTVNHGTFVWGGVSFGTEDQDNEEQQTARFHKWMAQRWGIRGKGVTGKKIAHKRCPVTNRLCALSNCTKTGEHGREFQIGPRHAGAPSCSAS